LAGLIAGALVSAALAGPAAAVEPSVGTGSVSGIVTDASTGAALSGVSVVVLDEAGAEAATATTGSTGGYTASGLEAGEYRLSFSLAPGYLPAFWPSAAEVTGAQKVSLAPGESVTGKNVALQSISGPEATPTPSPTEDPSGGESGGNTDPTQPPMPDPGPGETSPGPTSDPDPGPGDPGTGGTGGSQPDPTPTNGGETSTGSPDPTPTETNGSFAPVDPPTPDESGSAEAVPGEPGTISGRVVADATGDAIAYANVSFTGRGTSAYAMTDENGQYTAINVEPGSYRAYISAPGFAGEYYDNTLSWSSATLIEVTESSGVSGIDASLAPGSSISGVVTDASGSPLADVNVYVTGIVGFGGSAMTGADGAYSVTGLPADSYRVQFSKPGFPTEYYDDAGAYQDADLVTLGTGQAVAEIDAVLEEAGQISGTVLDYNGNPLAGIGVAASGSGYGWTNTAADGTYTITGLKPGAEYVVGFGGNEANASEYYDGVFDPADATKVTVVSGETTPNVDAQLTRSFFISGVIKDAATGENIIADEIGVSIFKADGTPYLGDGAPGGEFRLGGFPSGSSFYVQALDYGGVYASQFWQGAATLDDATLVTVGDEDVNLEFSLDRGASITGTISAEAEPAPYESTRITAYRWGGDSWSTVVDITGWSGYELNGLPAGEYTVGFTDPGVGDAYPYCAEYWDTQLTLDDADRFTLTAGGTQGGIDASLPSECDLPDVIAGTVTISGDGAVGSTLTADPGSWTPAPVELAYQWLSNGTPLQGQTAATITLTESLIGTDVSVQVTGSRPGYDSATASSNVIRVIGNLVPATPTITGHPVAGQTLTAVPGEWGPAPVSLAYQWLADDAVVEGATGQTFVPGESEVGKTISVRVTGSKANYASASRTSAPVGPVAAAPLLDLVPGTPVIEGTLRVGSTVTANPGEWGPAPVTLTYQWQVAGEDIPGATSNTYVLQPSDAGEVISVVVRGTKPGYNPATRTATATAAVEPGQIVTGDVTIAGSPRVGEVLTSEVGSWTPAGVTLAYQWLADGDPIDGATSTTYTVAPSDLGAYISLRVTGTAPGYTAAEAESNEIGPIAAGALIVGTPTLSNEPQVGELVTVDPGVWGPGEVTLAYQWFVDGEAIEGATGDRYTPTASDVGGVLSVTVTGSKPGYDTQSRSVAAEVEVAPRVELSETSVVRGNTVDVTAWGFGPGEHLLIELRSEPVELATVLSDAAGSASTTVTIPADTTPGDHTVVVTGQETGRTASAPLAVTAAPVPTPTPTPTTTPPGGTPTGTSGASALPATGAAAPWGLALIGLLMIAGGSVASIRRRSTV
jgi:LPXTG-motif cell wall-anchored protein